jgi:hypothetical protein
MSVRQDGLVQIRQHLSLLQAEGLDDGQNAFDEAAPGFTVRAEGILAPQDPRVRFIFGYDAAPGLVERAEQLPEKAWKKLERPPRYAVATQPRQRPENVKDEVSGSASLRRSACRRSMSRNSTISRRRVAKSIAWSWSARTSRGRRGRRGCLMSCATSFTSPTIKSWTCGVFVRFWIRLCGPGPRQGEGHTVVSQMA